MKKVKLEANAWLDVVRERDQSMNCRKCGGEIFIAAVDRGTNNTNAILHHIGCRTCDRRWLLAPSVIEALKAWIEFQCKEGLPVVFVSPCGGYTPRFERAAWVAFKPRKHGGARSTTEPSSPTAEECGGEGKAEAGRAP